MVAGTFTSLIRCYSRSIRDGGWGDVMLKMLLWKIIKEVQREKGESHSVCEFVS